MGLFGHNPKKIDDISNGGSEIDFFLPKCLTGGVERVESRVIEILTIIMLTATGWIGLGYGFGVEQFKPSLDGDQESRYHIHMLIFRQWLQGSMMLFKSFFYTFKVNIIRNNG